MKSHVQLFTLLFATSPLLAQIEKVEVIEQQPTVVQKEHEALKALVGKWDFAMKMEAMPGVPGMEEATESKGTEHAELICGGLWLKSVFNADFRGQPFQGVWIAGYDPFEKQYTSVWVSSDENDSGPSTMQGSYDAASKTWTWTGKSPQGETRSVMTVKDADRTVEVCYLKTADGKETKCMEITRTRSSGAPVAVAAAGARGAKALPPELATLHQDIGNWAVTIKMEGAPDESHGTERVAAICDGRWLWSNMEAQFMGAPFEGHALVGYDPNAKEYVNFWFDSTTATWMKTSGDFDAAKKAYTMTGNFVDPSGQPTKIHEVLTWKDADTRLLEMQFKSPEQTMNMQVAYKRKTK